MRAESYPPDIAEIVCHADGEATLVTPVIRTRPDGVHAWVTNNNSDGVHLTALGASYVPPGEAKEILWPTRPGRTKVACWDHQHHLKGPPPKEHPLVIRDIDGYWVDTKLDCPPGEGNGGWVNDFIDPQPAPPGPVTSAELRREARREWNIRPDDVVELAGYSEDAQSARLRVVREGRIVGTAAVGRVNGELVTTGGSFCSGLRSGTDR